MLNWDKKEETMKTLDLVVFSGGGGKLDSSQEKGLHWQKF